jgi:four helix bundle protein
MFDHEKLDVYQAAITFLGVAGRVIGRLPRGYAYFKDQLGRAALSIVTNTAEGAGEFAPAEKARLYRIALRSSTECAAILDACRKLGLGDGAVLAEGRGVLFRIVGMLTGLVKRHQKVALGDRQAGNGTYVAAHARREHEAGLDAVPDVAGANGSGGASDPSDQEAG